MNSGTKGSRKLNGLFLIENSTRKSRENNIARASCFNELVGARMVLKILYVVLNVIDHVICSPCELVF